MKDYNHRPEVRKRYKEYHKDYDKKYYERPGVREKHREVCREYKKRKRQELKNAK